MDGTQIYQNFQNGNTDSLQAAADVVKQLSDGYQDEATAIRDLQTRMNAAWTGNSGDAAMAGANPLAQAFIDSAPPLDITTNSMDEQSDVFQTSKAKVVEVPPAPDKPSGWSVGLKAAIPIVGPSMAAGDIQSYEDGVAATNAANENNVRVMQQYSAVTDSTRSSIPMDYKTLPIDGASVGLSPAKPGVIEPGHVEYADRTSTSSASSSSSVGGVGAVDPVRSGPNLTGPNNVTSSGHPAYIDAHPTPPGPDTTTTGRPTNPNQFLPGPPGYPTTNQTGPSGSRSTSTNAPGRNSAAGRLYDTEGGGSASGRGGSESTGRGGNLSGRGGSADESHGSGGGRGGAGGERAGRSGAVGEGARSLGAGKGTGAGNLSSAAAEEGAASRSAGRGANAGPIGAGGRRGEGAEDEEHRRPDYLIEPDPDSVFGTDVRATPPVIGE